MKIIAFGASTSCASINKTLATYAAHQISGATVTVLDLNNYKVPLFSEDKEKEIGKALGAERFLQDLSNADAIVVSFAEHNGTYTAAYKNLFDWATRIEKNVFKNKPVIYLATSPGLGGAKSVLASAINSAEHFGAKVMASLSVPIFYDNFDLLNNKCRNTEIEQQIKEAVFHLI